MNTKQTKLTIISLTLLSLILVLGSGLYSNFTSANFHLHEFLRGVLVGIGSVAFVVWIFALFSMLKNLEKFTSDATISVITMFILLASAIIAIEFSNNSYLSISGIVLMCSAIILNIRFLKNMMKHEIFCN